VVPGLNGSGPDHWQSKWAEAFGFARVEQTSWTAPKFDPWYRRLDHAIMCAGRPVLLIAHSLGAALSISWLQTTRCPERVAGAFLVAVADIDRTHCPEASRLQDFAVQFDRKLPVPSVMIASHNDEWLSFNRATLFARSLGSRIIDVGFAGHIGTAAKLGLWADGLSHLADFAETII